MSGFLIRAAKGEDASSEGDQLEEQYLRLFPKIGRDFVHKDDLESFVRSLVRQLALLGVRPTSVGDEEARRMASLYKDLLDSGGSHDHRDLINLDDDKIQEDD